MLREGRRPRAVARIEDIGSLRPIDPLRRVSAWSLATLAALATVCALYFARELMLPIVAAFVVGVMYRLWREGSRPFACRGRLRRF